MRRAGSQDNNAASSKRARVCDMAQLLHTGHVSNSGLVEIMKKMQQLEHLPEKNLKSIVDVAHKQLLKELTYTESLPLTNGGTFVWHIVETGLLLQKMLDTSSCLRAIYENALRLNPNQWRCVLCFDEYTPGNKLALNPSRKTMVISVSFLELQNLKALQVGWLTIAVIRTTQIHLIRGGFSHCLRVLLRRLFDGPLGLRTSGVPILVNGQRQLLYARLSCVLSDGDGLRAALDLKGSSGLLPCIKCKNVLKRDSDLSHRRGGFVETSCHEFHKFEAMTSDELATTVAFLGGAQQKVSEGAMTKTFFGELESLHGVNWNADGILSDIRMVTTFGIAESITYDWMHCMLQDGTLTSEVFLYIQSVGIGFQDVATFLKGRFVFPHFLQHRNAALHKVFSSYKSSIAAERLKCSASDLLGLYVLLRFYIETTECPRPNKAAEDSFNAACKCVDLLLAIKRGEVPIQEGGLQLQAAQCDYLRLHVAAHGTSNVRPKHHWALHVGQQIRRDSCVLDTFIVERLHLRTKRVAEFVSNTTAFEASTLAGVLNVQMQAVSEMTSLSGLVGRTAPVSVDGVPATCADALEHESWSLRCKDLVARDGFVGKVIACLATGQPASSSTSSSSSSSSPSFSASPANALLVVVEVYSFLSKVSTHATKFRRDAKRTALWKVSELEQVVAWYYEEDSVVALS
jgi:hypothetical protein